MTFFCDDADRFSSSIEGGLKFDVRASECIIDGAG
jgi:hypothetical protein